MAVHDLINELIGLLQREADGLDELCGAMREGRTAWLALRPGELQGTVDRLQHMADDNAAVEEGRRRIARQLATGLGLPETAPVSRLCSRLPDAVAARLRTAAARAAKAASGVRRESGMGRRLLEFSRLSQESLLQALGREVGNQARGYDRNAKAVVQAAAAGSFVDGRL